MSRSEWSRQTAVRCDKQGKWYPVAMPVMASDSAAALADFEGNGADMTWNSTWWLRGRNGREYTLSTLLLPETLKIGVSIVLFCFVVFARKSTKRTVFFFQILSEPLLSFRCWSKRFEQLERVQMDEKSVWEKEYFPRYQVLLENSRVKGVSDYWIIIIIYHSI